LARSRLAPLLQGDFGMRGDRVLGLEATTHKRLRG